MIKNKPKKLLFVCPIGDINSGGVISNYQLIKYLIEKGFVVRVITSWRGTYNAELNKNGIDNKVLEYNWWTPNDLPAMVSKRVIGATRDLVDEINDFNPDVVVTNTSHIPWGAFAASMTNKPHIWILREFPINNFQYLADKIHFINKYSNKLMANSKGLATYYKKEHGFDVGNFMSYVNLDGVTLGKDTGFVRLVSPNYLSKTKNQLELVKAVKILSSRRRDLEPTVVFMGEKDAKYWPLLEKEITKSGISDRIIVHDRVDDPWSLISSEDIFVQTSMSESIGRATTEAMKLGVPVIASDIPGHREAFDMGGGTLYELGNPNDLADKIEYALDNQRKVKNAALVAKAQALKNMSYEASNGPFLNAIEEVIGSDNPMGVNQQIAPYLEQYVKDLRMLEKAYKNHEKIIAQKNKETDFLMGTIEQIRSSHTYRIGSFQVNTMKKISNSMKGILRIK